MQKTLQKMLAITLLVTLMMTTILSHKLPEVGTVPGTDSTDGPTQPPLQCLDSLVARVLHVTQLLANQCSHAPVRKGIQVEGWIHLFASILVEKLW